MRGYFSGEVDLFQIERLAFGIFFDRLACELIEPPPVVSNPTAFDDFEVSKMKKFCNAGIWVNMVTKLPSVNSHVTEAA